MRNFTEKCRQFFFHKCAMMLILLDVKPFFEILEKKSTGSTGNTGTWNILILGIHNFLKSQVLFKYSVLELPVLEIQNKYPCTWSTAQLWY